jgi:hypothetical protein
VTAEGLDAAEELVLSGLEDSPQPLWELTWDETLSPERCAAVLGPALVSLAARGFVDVRRFDDWPADWALGVPIAGDDLLRESRVGAAWARHDGTDVALVAHITGTGTRYL